LGRMSRGGKRLATVSKQAPIDRVADVLASLQDSTIKFSQRTEFLNSLQVLLNDANARAVRGGPEQLEAFVSKNMDTLSEVVRVLLDYIAKQKHPLVVAATLHCVGTLVYGELMATQFGGPWRSLAIETIHMLRNNNKQIFDATLGVLFALYRAKSLSFAYIASTPGGLLLEILSGPRSSGGGASSAGAVLVPGGTNVSKIVAWLDSAGKMDVEAALRAAAQIAESSKSGDVAATTPSVSHQQVESSAVVQSHLLDALRKISPLIAHREEVARDASISLSVSYLTLHALHSRYSFASFTAFVKDLQDAPLSEVRGLVAAGNADLQSVFEAIDKAAPRGAEKLTSNLLQNLIKAASDMVVFRDSAVAASLAASAAIASTVPTTPPRMSLESAGGTGDVGQEDSSGASDSEPAFTGGESLIHSDPPLQQPQQQGDESAESADEVTPTKKINF
jgi:hypothetical protein